MTGSGTQADPYIIYNYTDLRDVNDDLTAYYELGNDIDATDSAYEGGGFPSIGVFSGTAFTGNFDGKGYTISDLTASGSEGGILFYKDEGATIKNIKLTGVYGGRGSNAAIFTGRTTNSLWSKCGAVGILEVDSGAMSSEVFAGFSTRIDGSDVDNCYIQADIDCSSHWGDYAYIAGFVGIVGNDATINDCYYVGDLIPTTGSPVNLKAFCVENTTSAIINCYYNETVTSYTDEFASGLTEQQMIDEFYYNTWDFTNIWFIHTSINNGYPELYEFDSPPESYEGNSPSNISITTESSGLANMHGASEPQISIDTEGLGTPYTHPVGNSKSYVMVGTESSGEKLILTLEARQSYNDIYLNWS